MVFVASAAFLAREPCDTGSWWAVLWRHGWMEQAMTVGATRTRTRELDSEVLVRLQRIVRRKEEERG